MDEDTEADRFFDELLRAVDEQLASPRTPYVRKILERLVKAGLEEDEAREAIARTLAEESDRMFRTRRPFDEDAYRNALEAIDPDE